MKNIYHLFVAVAANVYYGFPARKLTVIGITGTDGKTTTSSLIYHILKTAGKNVSLISTVAAYINDKTYDTGFHVTNPSSVALQKFLRKIVRSAKGKENYLVLEVTSHGIDQNRIWGIPFKIAGLTNITHEHLDYHKTYKNYLTTKAKLLQKADITVINIDDQSFGQISKLLHDKTVITYGVHHNADVTPKTLPFTCNMPGEYSVYNCLLAAAICKSLGIAESNIQNGIATFQLPVGRADIIYKKDFTVMVDFAHTPHAIEQILQAVKPQVKGKLIHIFGSAGLRDKSKRPLMGKASSHFADSIILTAEDPRTEDVKAINKQIKTGIAKNKTVLEIPDRQKAIAKAIEIAKKDDFIIITGKGHEQSMNYGHGEVPWSDKKEVEKSLKIYGK